jgi:hypothetical protein
MKTNCLNCQKEFEQRLYQTPGKYCSKRCECDHRSILHKIAWYAGTLKKRIDRATIRKYLAEDRGYKCEVSGCSLSEWLGKKITLQVDHIDGNPEDDSPSNVRLICPNCHSQTPFLGNGNKGRGRGSLGLPLR